MSGFNKIKKRLFILTFFIFLEFFIIKISYFTTLQLIPVCNTNNPSDFPNSTKITYDLSLFRSLNFENSQNEFERAIRMINWTHFKNPASSPKYATSQDPTEILLELEKGNKVVCGGLSILSAAVLSTHDFKVRVVQLVAETGLFSKNYTHVVVEVWVDNYDKWVLLDPTFNGYWIINETPLSALEIHDIVVNGKIRDATFVTIMNQTQIPIENSYKDVVNSFVNIFYLQEIRETPRTTGIDILDSFLKQYSKKCWIHYVDDVSHPVYYSNIFRIFVFYIIPFSIFMLLINIVLDLINFVKKKVIKEYTWKKNAERVLRAYERL